MALSHDGSWLLVRTAESMFGLFPIAGGPLRLLTSVPSEYHPITFSAKGKYLFVINTRERPRNVRRIEIATGANIVWKEIPAGDPAGIVAVSAVQITPDGQSLAWGSDRILSEFYLATGLH